MKLVEAIEIAKEFLGKEYFQDLDIKYHEDNDRSLLEIKKDKNNVLINYGEKASLFYALTLLKRYCANDELDIHLNRHFESNGVMHDCSRNGPLNLDQAKQMILVNALFGLNRFMLYTEDVYEIKDEPFFGYFRGRYTKDELKELDQYALSFGVELVPCIQTLSHLLQALKWPHFDNVRDTWNTLMAGKEETYQLIEKMLDTCKECFASKNIHIGMDEAIDMASGPFIFKDTVLDKKELFLSHLNKVVELCNERGLHPMMWADMFFKLENDNTNGHVDWYQFKGKISDKTKSLIPDVDLIFWDYYHDDKKVYDHMFEACIDTKKRTIFAGGAISWIGFAPNIIQSMRFSEIGIKSAINHGVKDIFTTSWGDNGNECSVAACYPTLALHSMFEFYGKNNKQELSKILEAVTGDPLSRWALLQEVNHIRPAKEMAAYENASKPFLYQDVLMGVVDSKIKLEYADRFKLAKRKLNIAANKSIKYGYVYKTLAALSDLLTVKATLGLRLRKAYKENDRNELYQILKDIKVTSIKLKRFKEQFRLQWNIENKPFGFDVIDGRLGFIASRLETAHIRLDEYLAGKVKSIPELEIEILPWQNQTTEEEFLVGNWSEVSTPNAL